MFSISDHMSPRVSSLCFTIVQNMDITQTKNLYSREWHVVWNGKLLRLKQRGISRQRWTMQTHMRIQNQSDPIQAMAHELTQKRLPLGWSVPGLGWSTILDFEFSSLGFPEGGNPDMQITRDKKPLNHGRRDLQMFHHHKWCGVQDSIIHPCHPHLVL